MFQCSRAAVRVTPHAASNVQRKAAYQCASKPVRLTGDSPDASWFHPVGLGPSRVPTSTVCQNLQFGYRVRVLWVARVLLVEREVVQRRVL